MSTVQHQSGLRARKKERTRQAVIDSAWALFREKGYDATTVEEIAEHAQISRRTFFRYFPTKEAVVFHNAADRLAMFRDLLVAGGSGLGAVTGACLALALHYEHNRDLVVEQYKLIESSPALTMREGEIDREWMEAIAETLAPQPTTVALRRGRIMAGAVFGVMRATLAEWLEREGRTSLQQLGTQAMSIFKDEAA